MLDVGLGELIVIGILALLVFGPDRLPKVAADAAKMLRQIRTMAVAARKDLADAAGMDSDDELTQAVRDIRDLDPRRALRGLGDEPTAGPAAGPAGAAGRTGGRSTSGSSRSGGATPVAGPATGAGTGSGSNGADRGSAAQASVDGRAESDPAADSALEAAQDAAPADPDWT